MVAHETSIPHKNITRYKQMLEVKGVLYQVERKACKRTDNLAWYLTTNPDYVDKTSTHFYEGYQDQGDADVDGQYDMFQ